MARGRERYLARAAVVAALVGLAADGSTLGYVYVPGTPVAIWS